MIPTYLERIEESGYTYASRLEELVKVSDILTLHTPLTSENYHMVNREILATAKDGVIIVSTARGELIDIEALIEYVKLGKVRAVALDVVEGEPISSEHPLLKYGNVIVTPHIAAHTEEGVRGMDEAVVEAIINFLEDKPIDGVVVSPKNPRRVRPS
ncbi:MAG: NAD(P)-dependent oxidoreductase [Sulfolobales archaeon]|nr:hypothetical protein [Sulfolobales archaeon]MDW8082902.1 NAD(P)-dependent oxidoreductase [Sulfolobales archaeon]